MKTFPIILTTEEHRKIKLEAYKRGQTIKEFIMIAIMNNLTTKVKKEDK